MAGSRISRVAPIGKQFGRVVVIGGTMRRRAKATSVLCRCTCGDERQYFITNLQRQAEPMCPACRERSRPSKGQSGKHPLFNIWKAIIQRCENPNHTFYRLYGGRGISICPRWRNNFEAFAADMGKRPTPRHTVDRMDVNGDYESGNCRWATMREQGHNRRNNRVLQWAGQRLTLSEAASRAGISAALLAWRLNRGWTLTRAMTQPKRPDRRTDAKPTV